MNVLEMEQESESLVGSKHQGAAAAGKQNRSSSGVGGGLAKAVFQRNFMANVVAVAGAVLLLLLYISGNNSASEDDNFASSGEKGAQHKPSPVASPTISADISPGGDPTRLRTKSPMSSPPTSPPVAAAAPDEPLPMNLYSKFATMPPMEFVKPPDEATKKKLSQDYGHWHFWDDDEELRPAQDYLSKYPNRDVPNDDFPEGAWQTDAVYVNHFLSIGGELVERAMEAIYAEYGYPAGDMTPEELEERSKKIFYWKVFGEDEFPGFADIPKDMKKTIAGVLPKRTYDGLIRRLLHAMMTADTFTVVVGGHSVVAGAG